MDEQSKKDFYFPNMDLVKQELLGVRINVNSKNEILQTVEDYLLKKKLTRILTIFTPNPEQIVEAQKNSTFNAVLNSADIALPDGVGIVWGCRLLVAGCKLSKTIPGIEFMEDLVQLAAEKGYTVGLIGGKSGIAQKALERLQARYSGLRGWVHDPGKVDLDNLGNLSYLSEKIRINNTRIIFVGLGAPKQEYFINQLTTHNSQLTTSAPLVLMSMGGAFDELSGRIARAPKWMSNRGLKWLWRLFLEPWRWRRQLALIKFLIMLMRKKIA